MVNSALLLSCTRFEAPKQSRCLAYDYRSIEENVPISSGCSDEADISKEINRPQLQALSPNKANPAVTNKCFFSSPTKSRTPISSEKPDFFIDTSLLDKQQLQHRRDSHDNENMDQTSVTVASDCGTEVSSVAHLRGWLDDFGKQHQDHFHKTALLEKPGDCTLEKPTRPKVHRATPKKTPVAAATRPTPSASSRKTPNDLPASRQAPRVVNLRYKARVKQEEVQATDSGYASVAKLSAWLADDPTSTKKVKPIRRGMNVIAKSRMFDKELENVEFEPQVVPQGHVASRTNWLNQVASQDSNDDESKAASSSVKDEETVVSVNDKRAWLSHAFDTSKKKANSSFKAHTDIVTSRDERDANSNRAKQMWRSKCQTTPPRPRTTPVRPQECRREGRSQEKRTELLTEQRMDEAVEHRQAATEPRDAADSEEFGFHAARNFLVQKSKANGNAVSVYSKFQRRKEKFQKLEKEAARRQSIADLPSIVTKTSWESNSSNESGRYVKKMVVQEVCPKRSFEELP